MVGTLVSVGRGKIEVDKVKEILDSKIELRLDQLHRRMDYI